MRYTVLSRVRTDEIVECVNKAFSDYAKPIHFTESTLHSFFMASDINTALSFCAYSENTMVGFILNSTNIYHGEQVAFDAGAGVIPEFRGKGVFSALYAFAEHELRKCGIKKYYLEVLQQNDRAKSLYERNGFSVVRELSVMQLTNASDVSDNRGIQVVGFAEFDFSGVSDLTQVMPSYEHSYNVIKKNPHLYKVAYLENDSRITAFCVYDADAGSLTELGYDHVADLKEVLKYIACHYEAVVAKNIDTSYCSVMEMMLSIGFQLIAGQYEMVKEIPADKTNWNLTKEVCNMSDELSLVNLQNQMQIENAKQEIRDCNAVSERYGLKLNEDEIREIVECRATALKDTGRIEFAGGILPKLIYAFCDSPYMEKENYESTLAELQEAFYYFKGEALELFTDDELIEFMVKVFNGRAQGSAEYLIGTSLDSLCRYARSDYDPENADEAGDLF